MQTASGRWHRWRLLVVPLLLVAGCQGAAPPAAPPPREAADTAWHTLGTWSGRGDRQTDSFDVTTGALRLRWQARGAAAGRLRVSLHSAISGRPLQTVLDVSGAGGADVYFQDEPRVSYLVIESDRVDWQVTVEEAASR